MDLMNQNTTENMGEIGRMQAPKKSYGALIAVIIILAIMVIGGLYFLGQRMNRTPYQTTPTDTTSGDQVSQSLKQQSSSDDTASIEADLKATNVDNLDQGASALEADMNTQQQ